MTSNIGSDYILEKNINSKELINHELHSTFKPEFLNRIDEIVMFNPLNKEILYDILDNIIKDLNNRLKDKHIIINLSKESKDCIINNAYSETYGARPLKRYVSKNIESLIANAIIKDEIKTNSEITIDYSNNCYILK